MITFQKIQSLTRWEINKPTEAQRLGQQLKRACPMLLYRGSLTDLIKRNTAINFLGLLRDFAEQNDRAAGEVLKIIERKEE